MAIREKDHVDDFLAAIAAELPDLDLRVEGIVDRIGGLSRRIHRLLDETLAEHRLTHREFRGLSLLRRAGPPYTQTPGELAAQADLSTGAMTNRLDRLEDAGFVRRLPDENDRRSVQVELTPAGREAYERAVAAQAAKESLIAGALSPREQDELNRLLRKVMRAFEARDGGSVTC